MKHTFKYILFISALFSFCMTSYAQDVRDTYHNEGKGVATDKQVSGPNDDGSYTITLETFATGESVSITKSLPADIVLVLDLSQSMTENYGSSYTQQASQAYTPNQINSNEYYYKDGENYYRVRRGGNNNNNRFIYADVNNNSQWNSGTDIRLGDTGNNNNPTWEGILYVVTSRLQALQSAVESFLEVIYHNDNYEDETYSKLRGEPLSNKLSIVTFGGPQGNNNVTRISSDLTAVTNADRSKNTSMISDLLALTNNGINNSQHYGTYSDEGMLLANNVLGNISTERKEESSRTVVLFTDGAPGSGPGWTTGTAATNSAPTSNRTIAAALTAKSTHEATVYTVVVGGIANEEMGHYLQYTSSNYPEAESLTLPHAGEDKGYALDAEEDMEGVFTTIASQSGGSSQSIPATSQVRDVVSSSFNLPEGFNANSVTVYTVDVKPSGQEFYSTTDSDYAQHKHTLTVVTGQTGEGEANADYLTNEEKVLLVIGSDRLSVEGFDYSKGDGDILGSGNWVGPRISGSQSTFYGKKLVIEFNIVPETDATGGDATNTNAAGSGVYVIGEDGQYHSVNDYEPPHTDLPTIIKISKKGLRRGESATFQIVKYRPIGYNESNPSDISNYQWTVVGKPMPDPATQEDFSKVILTNKNGDENTEITKTLMALDPSWIYEVYEDDWAWSYTYDGSVSMTTSDVEVNPFRFTNSKNEEAVKHAEAVSINHFANETIGLDSRVENIKSNETFDTN